MNDVCFNPWIKFYSERFIFRNGQERLEVAAKIDREKSQKNPSYKPVNLINKTKIDTETQFSNA
jgi:hypothetical protein